MPKIIITPKVSQTYKIKKITVTNITAKDYNNEDLQLKYFSKKRDQRIHKLDLMKQQWMEGLKRRPGDRRGNFVCLEKVRLAGCCSGSRISML